MIRPATWEDVKNHAVLRSATFRGYVAEINGKVEGIAGYLYEDEILQGFSWKGDLTPRQVVELARVCIKMCEAANAPIYSIPSKEYEGSERFLKYLGFKHYRDNIFIWDNSNGCSTKTISKHTSA